MGQVGPVVRVGHGENPPGRRAARGCGLWMEGGVLGCAHLLAAEGPFRLTLARWSLSAGYCDRTLYEAQRGEDPGLAEAAAGPGTRPGTVLGLPAAQRV